MNEPLVNIRYRDEIKNRLEQRGNVLAYRIVVAGATLAALLLIAWRIFMR